MLATIRRLLARPMTPRQQLQWALDLGRVLLLLAVLTAASIGVVSMDVHHP